MLKTTAGTDNVAAGNNAMLNNTTGDFNVAIGGNALFSQATPNRNVAVGFNSLRKSTGGSNVALGSQAGNALTTGANNVMIANSGVAADAATIRIGTNGKQTAAYLAGVYGKTVSGTAKAVIVNAGGKLGTQAVAGASEVQTLRSQVADQQEQIDELQRAVAKLAK